MTIDRRRLGAAAALTVALGLVLAWCAPGHMVIEIPEGYRGPVVIFFGHPKGTTPGWNWAKRIFRVPPDGTLRIQDKLRWRRWNEEWVFVSPEGKRTPIPSFDDHQLRNTAITQPGRIQNVVASEGAQHWIQASIVVPADRENFHENPHFVVSRLKEEIQKLEAGKK